MVNLSDYAIFRESLSTLKTTSVDDHDSLTQNFMTGSERTVVDFDLVKERYIEHLGLSDIPKSNDALLDAGEGKLVFIEFKNGYIDKRMQFDIRRKIYDSTLIFRILCLPELAVCASIWSIFLCIMKSPTVEIRKRRIRKRVYRNRLLMMTLPGRWEIWQKKSMLVLG